MTGYNGEPLQVPTVNVGVPVEIATAITKVMADVDYIEKDGWNDFHRFKFVTVGSLLGKLQPSMAKHGLIVFQTEQSREFLDDGRVLSITYLFSLAHASGVMSPFGSLQTGLAVCRNSKGGFDDKAANKCHTAARKYFLLATFQVPSGDLPDSDMDGDEEPKAPVKAQAAKPEEKPSDEELKLRETYSGIVKLARNAQTVPQAVELLARYAKDSAELEKLRSRKTAWTTINDEVSGAVIRAYGPKIGAMWRASAEAVSDTEIMAVNQKWSKDYEADVKAFHAQHPEAYDLVKAHMISHYERIMTKGA